ncbi:unnamed protein product [Heterobilharzia americana]|nr:unnamed protein product [Heterobilharzia americana]
MSDYRVFNSPSDQPEWDPASEVESMMCRSRLHGYTLTTGGSHTLPRQYNGNYYYQRETNPTPLIHRGVNAVNSGGYDGGGALNVYSVNPQYLRKMYHPWASPTMVRQFTTIQPSYQTSVGYDPSMLYSSSPSASVCSDGQLYYRSQRLVKPLNQPRYVLGTKITSTTNTYSQSKNALMNSSMYNTLQISGHSDQPSIQRTSLTNPQIRTRLQYPSALVRTIVRMESSGPKDFYSNAHVQETRQQQSSEIPPALPIRTHRSTGQETNAITKPRHLIPIPLYDRMHLDPNMTSFKYTTDISNSSHLDNNLPQSVLIQPYHSKNTFDLESHLDCSCDYVKGEAGLWPADIWYERNFHTVDKCTCPHEEVHRFFDNTASKWKLADAIAMLPIRETDILDDLIDSTSDEDETTNRSLSSVKKSRITIHETEYDNVKNRTERKQLIDGQSDIHSCIKPDLKVDDDLACTTRVTCYHIANDNNDNSNNNNNHNDTTIGSSTNVSCDEDDLVPLGELLSSNTNLIKTITSLGKPQSSLVDSTTRITPRMSIKQSLHCLDVGEKDTSSSRRNSDYLPEERKFILDTIEIPAITTTKTTPTTVYITPSTPGGGGGGGGGGGNTLDAVSGENVQRKSFSERTSPLWKETQVLGTDNNVYMDHTKLNSNSMGRSYIRREKKAIKDEILERNIIDTDVSGIEQNSELSIKQERRQSSPRSTCHLPEPDGCISIEDNENTHKSLQIDNVANALDRLHWDMRSTIEGKLTDKSMKNTLNKENSSLQLSPKEDLYTKQLDKTNQRQHIKHDWIDDNQDNIVDDHFRTEKAKAFINNINIQENESAEHDQHIDVDHYFLQPRTSILKSHQNDIFTTKQYSSNHFILDNQQYDYKSEDIHDLDENEAGKECHYEINHDDDDHHLSMMERDEGMHDSMEFNSNYQSGQNNKLKQQQQKAMERWDLLRTHIGKVGRQKAEDNDSISALGFYRSIESQPEQQPWGKKAIPMVSDLVLRTMAQKRTLTSLSSSLASWTLTDQELKMHVYRKALQALAYPISSNTPHNFQLFSATSPTYCYECEGLLWGVARQGLRCTECGVKCHDKCKRLLNADCLQRAAEKSLRHGAVDKAQAAMEAIHALIQRRITERSDIFEFLANVFQIDVHSNIHLNALEFAQKSIVAGASQWSAKIAITVKSAQGLIGKDKTGRSDPYVTVQVGKVRKRTKTVLQELNPTWDEKFLFECDNASERIKLRVWDEDNDLKSKIRQKFTRESDDFLGQTIIEVRTLSGEMDVWYNLEKRTDKSAVSGAIRLQISVEIKGEEQMASFHVQYTALHGSIFCHLCKENEPVFLPDRTSITNLQTSGSEAWRVYFNPLGQEIVDEFAIRYGIEPIFQAMTHFACLTAKYNCPGVPAQLSVLLANINAFYAHTTSSNSQTASERFSASNFGREKFIKLLDSLYIAIRIDLSKYRTVFPASQPERLIDLKSTVDLLTSITFFRLKVQELSSPPRTGQILRECIEACIHATYQCLCENVHDLYGKSLQATNIESGTPETGPTDNTSGGVGVGQSLNGELDQMDGMRSLTYWHRLITLVVSVLEDDRKHYAPVLNQFPHEINLGDMSAEMVWKCLSEDLANGLAQHTVIAKYYYNNNEEDKLPQMDKLRNGKQNGKNEIGLKSGMHKIKSSDYMNLCFRVKWFYNTYIAPLARFKNVVPQYPRWFEGLVLIWLSENDEVSANYLRNAYDRDKQDGFQCSSEHVLYSNSVVDVFTQLNQCFDVIRKLECPDKEVEGHFLHRFSLGKQVNIEHDLSVHRSLYLFAIYHLIRSTKTKSNKLVDLIGLF